eukprot:1317617-Amorphochlora_amoeboformis.AAC.1
MESTSRSGSPLFVMRGHREAVNCVGFTSIGNKRCIVSGHDVPMYIGAITRVKPAMKMCAIVIFWVFLPRSGDGEVRIWDLSSRRPIVATHAHGSSVLQATSMCK